MLKELSAILMAFSPCFSRVAAFRQFVVVVFGFLVRLDFRGVTSLIRWLALEPGQYETLLHFFKASSWRLAEIQQCWANIIQRQCSLVMLNGHFLMVGDGIKINKEARKMPGVKKLHQESDNSGKAPFIFGHHFGVVGLLTGTAKSMFCVPVMAEIHEGMETIRTFQGKQAPVVNDQQSVTIVTLMISLAGSLARHLAKPSLLILDAYYAVGPTFILAKEYIDETGQRLLHVITRAKNDVVGYTGPPPTPDKPGRGRPPVWGEKVKLREQFNQRANEFQTLTLTLYGKEVTLSYLCLDLLWRPIKEKVRFVLVKDGSDFFILMCSNLQWLPGEIIQAYSYRFKIEVAFKGLKHLLGSFYYRFWTKAMPKLHKKSSVDLSCITDAAKQRLIAETVNAIEGFVNFGCIAFGILQILAQNYPLEIWRKYTGWLRTKKTIVPSEEVVRLVIQENFYHNFDDFSNTAILQIIGAKRRRRLYLYGQDAA